MGLYKKLMNRSWCRVYFKKVVLECCCYRFSFTESVCSNCEADFDHLQTVTLHVSLPCSWKGCSRRIWERRRRMPTHKVTNNTQTQTQHSETHTKAPSPILSVYLCCLCHDFSKTLLLKLKLLHQLVVVTAFFAVSWNLIWSSLKSQI